MNRQNSIDFLSHLSKKKSFKRELLLLIIVGIIGCLGTMVIFKKCWKPQEQVKSKTFTSITIPDQVSNLNKARRTSPFLNILGKFVPGQELSFTINNYNSKATYEVNFGDGIIKNVKDANFNYTYQNEGKYTLEMIMHYRDKSSQVFEGNINISSLPPKMLTSI